MELTIGNGEKKKTLKELHGPLRKVVRFYMKKLEGFKTEFPYELLECGHEIMQKRDIYGYTNASSRRCHKCRDEGGRTMLAPDTATSTEAGGQS